LSRQFIGGSEDKPVSTAKMCLVKSPKASVMLSKPPMEPKAENHGVQIWAGTNKFLASAFKVNFSRSYESSPKIGRPSEAILPIASKLGLDLLGRFQRRRKDQIMHLAHLIMTLIDIGDLNGKHKTYLPPATWWDLGVDRLGIFFS
jgi:hypothetical protein